ncbi:MAG: TRAP transporter substrate-binding protein [Eubacteriales bacterium]|nr:TRAP transporter substrate-binding protein [Eubacteriales bacterium]
MKRNRTIALLMALVLAVSFCFTGCSIMAEKTDSDVKVIRVAVSASADDISTRGYKKLAEILDKESNGRLKIQVFSDAVLGDDRSTVEAVQENTLDAADSSTPNFAPFMQEFMAFDLPYITDPKNQQQLYNALDYGALGDYYRKLCSERGFHLIGFFEYGYRNFALRKKRVRSVDDMKGLKLRTTNSAVEISVARALGAQAMPLGWSETYTALSQGTVDGEGNTWTLLDSAHHGEVLKYGINTRHNYSGKVFLMSKKTWNSLSDSDQKLLTKCFFEAVDWQRKQADKMEEDAEKKMKKGGTNIYHPTAAQLKEFKDKTRPVWDQYVGKRVPEEAVKLIQETQSSDYKMVKPDYTAGTQYK